MARAWSGRWPTRSGIPLTLRRYGFLVEEMTAVGGRLGQIALELAPAFPSDQEAADPVLARYAEEVGIDVETAVVVRRYPRRSPASAARWKAPGSDHRSPLRGQG
ncbi:hypothetical protein [Streptomyces flavidovirens]